MDRVALRAPVRAADLAGVGGALQRVGTVVVQPARCESLNWPRFGGSATRDGPDSRPRRTCDPGDRLPRDPGLRRRWRRRAQLARRTSTAVHLAAHSRFHPLASRGAHRRCRTTSLGRTAAACGAGHVGEFQPSARARDSAAPPRWERPRGRRRRRGLDAGPRSDRGHGRWGKRVKHDTAWELSLPRRRTTTSSR